MIELNLLPDVKKEYLKAQSFRAKTISLSILATIVAVGATAVLAAYVYGGQKLVSTLQKNDIEAKTKELKGKKDIDKYLTIQSQLKDISGLHDQKNMTSRVLSVLPKLNPPAPNNVKLANASFTVIDGSLSLQGSVKDFSALTTFRDTLTNAKLTYTKDGQNLSEPLFSEVAITQSGYGKNDETGSSVGFSIITKFNPNLIAASSKNVSVSVPNIETTQSVVASPALFVENSGASNGQ